jgi:quercetin dioxygenase-like cupin family protein
LALGQKTPAPLKAGAASQAAPASKTLTPAELKWGPPPPGLPTNGQLAVLDGNPMQEGFFTVRLRMPDGYTIKPHAHSRDEHVTVISGLFSVGMGDKLEASQMKELPAGGYTSLPAGHHHYARAKGETIVQIAGPGPFDIIYLNPTDDPRLKRSSR